MRNDLGMAIEHKPAGKFDSEAERVAQPAGFAYMAPPGQGSNQYGYWDHRDGRDFWVFYGQYALMRDLLFNHSYRPIDRYDWEGYRDSWRSGRTYYGRDEAAGAPRYGSQGTVTQDRYAGSNYAKSGGFRDSQYARRAALTAIHRTPRRVRTTRTPTTARGTSAMEDRKNRTRIRSIRRRAPCPAPPSARPACPATSGAIELRRKVNAPRRVFPQPLDRISETSTDTDLSILPLLSHFFFSA